MHNERVQIYSILFGNYDIFFCQLFCRVCVGKGERREYMTVCFERAEKGNGKLDVIK